MVYRHYTNPDKCTQWTEYNVETTNTSKQAVGVELMAPAVPTMETQSTNNKHT